MGNKAKRNTAIIFSIALIILIFVLYKNGYRVTENFSIGKIGQLNINLPIENTSIIIDKKIKINSEKNIETISLSPNTHEIIISKEGYYPWVKKIKIPSKESVSIDPFFVNQNASGEMITVVDSDYWKIKRDIQTSVLPTKENPLISQDKEIQIWIENNAVISKTKDSFHTVIEPDTIIKNISFYKNRDDVIIFSTYNGVYAIETDTENTQNFMPIYKGVDPYFATSTENSIYILDKDILMEVVI